MKTCALLLCSNSPTVNLPNARPATSAYEIGFGSGAAFLRAGPLPSLRISGEASFEKMTVNANVTLFQGQSAEVFQNYGLRYILFDSNSFILASYLNLTYFTGASEVSTRLTDRLGLALMTIGEKWTFDASLSVYGHQIFPNSQTEWSTLNVFDTAFGSELGVGRQLNSQHALRVGLMGPMPVVSHFWLLPKGTLKNTIGALGDQVFLQVEYAIH